VKSRVRLPFFMVPRLCCEAAFHDEYCIAVGMRDPILMTVIASGWLALGLNVGRRKSCEAVVLTLLINELIN
jgi:hypothetical protein